MTPPRSEELAALMVAYGPALHRYFVRKAGANLADDLVQEVFLRLQISAEHGALEGVERFIFRTAKRVLIDRMRLEASRGAGLHDPYDDERDENLHDDITPERTLAAKQEFARVLKAITDMPANMQLAFILHRFGRLSFSAISKRMGISRSAVQRLMERAVMRIASEAEDAP